MNMILDSKYKRFICFYLLIPAVFISFSVYFMHIRQVFQFDPDEGIELMKASLYSEGFSLYTQIWNDQPPLFTVLLSYCFEWLGKSVFTARIVILGFATLLLWSFSQIVRTFSGVIPALISMLLLMVSSNFLVLSVSVMFGLPSMALAMFSLYMLILYRQQPRLYWVFPSGFIFGLSLQTKLFTIFLIPVFIYLLIGSVRERYDKTLVQSLVPSLCWLSALLGTFVAIGLVCHSLSFEQLIQANLGENVRTAAVKKESNVEIIFQMFLQDPDFLLLGATGIVMLARKRLTQHGFPLVWLVVAILTLLYQKPIWWHYYLLVSIPLTWLSAYGVQLAVDYFCRQNWLANIKLSFNRPTLGHLAAIFLVLSIIAIPIKLTYAQLANHKLIQEMPKDAEVVNQLLKYQKQTHWVFTDLPMYTFCAGLKVPPEIAVFSNKRLKSGNLTIDNLFSVLKKYKPEQIVLGRFPDVQAQLSEYINRYYLKLYQNQVASHYVLKKIKHS